jgi:hypothetical protein
MATAQVRAEVQYELRALADYDATFSELLDHVDERNGTLGSKGFSGDQEEDLQLYCWVLCNRKSGGPPSGAGRIPAGLDDDIGA